MNEAISARLTALERAVKRGIRAQQQEAKLSEPQEAEEENSTLKIDEPQKSAEEDAKPVQEDAKPVREAPRQAENAPAPAPSARQQRSAKNTDELYRNAKGRSRSGSRSSTA